MIRFAKAHAHGNDFLYVQQDEVGGVSLETFARAICDRHAGVGGDGLIVYQTTAAGASMRLFNADGSPAEVSGNGVRALAALVLGDSDRSEIVIQTEAGPKRLTRKGRTNGRHTFRAEMGLPIDVVQMPISAAGDSLEVVVMTFGNPQAVVLGPLPPDERFRRLGAALERHEIFPNGTNVEFAHIEAPDAIRIIIWERGVGPTTSSGTGSCAALVAAAAFGGAASAADVIAPGGAQRVEWLDDSVYLTGWAELICEGQWLGNVPIST